MLVCHLSFLFILLSLSQDDHDDNSHVLTDFFLEELLRTNDTGSNMFHLPDSFEVK